MVLRGGLFSNAIAAVQALRRLGWPIKLVTALGAVLLRALAMVATLWTWGAALVALLVDCGAVFINVWAIGGFCGMPSEEPGSALVNGISGGPGFVHLLNGTVTRHYR